AKATARAILLTVKDKSTSSMAAIGSRGGKGSLETMTADEPSARVKKSSPAGGEKVEPKSNRPDRRRKGAGPNRLPQQHHLTVDPHLLEFSRRWRFRSRYRDNKETYDLAILTETSRRLGSSESPPLRWLEFSRSVVRPNGSSQSRSTVRLLTSSDCHCSRNH